MNFRLVFHVLALLLLVSCSKQEESAADAAGAEMSEQASLSKRQSTVEGSAQLATELLTSNALTQDPGERRFVISSSLNFRVKRVQEAALKFEDLAARHGGFVIDNTITADIGRTDRTLRGDGTTLVLSEYITRGSLVVRVPSAHTQAFIRELAPFVVFLDKRQFTAQDVHLELLTQQLLANRSVSTQSQLDELSTQSGKIDQKAQIIEKSSVARSSRDEAEINRLLLEDKIGFSTIELAIYQNPEISRNVVSDFETVRRANRSGFLSSIGVSLKSGWIGLLSFVIALLSIWPALLAGGLALVLLRMRKRKN